MTIIPTIDINDFYYDLPQERIAQFPLKIRDKSKLLIYHNHHISESHFRSISDYIPENSLLVYNETRVIQARLKFFKETGALIEIFCLEPVKPTRELQQAFQQGPGVIWKCLVGNSKKWKSGILSKKINLNNEVRILTAKRIEAFQDHSLIEFFWDDDQVVFSQVLENSGIIPLPPYMNREAIDSDKTRYQTIYARSEGSVAAPTAGLHFTEPVIDKLKAKNISTTQVILHVGAGTFKPVSSNDIQDHIMHTEQIFIQKSSIEKILEKLNKKIAVVGTTSMRTVESLYWHGVKLINGESEVENINIQQWDPYLEKNNSGISTEQSLNIILKEMNTRNLELISGQTQLMIAPGYKFKIPEILITNFHMPKSTLLLLVSAFIGEEWKNVYEYALNNDFRFLSYGDSCLFCRH